MADANAKYFKFQGSLNLIFIHVLMPIGVQEKESIMSVRYWSRVFPWNFILGDTSPHRHLFKGTFRVILGDNYMTPSRKKANFRGHYVSHERKFRGHLKKSRAKSSFFEGQ